MVCLVYTTNLTIIEKADRILIDVVRIFRNTPASKIILYVYRNSPCVVIGRNQVCIVVSIIAVEDLLPDILPSESMEGNQSSSIATA